MHFGLICPELSDHLNPMTTLRRELRRRGNRVTFGVGEVVPPRQVTVERLRDAIERVLGDPRYRENARRRQQKIEQLNGLAPAADIVEQAIITRAVVR